MFFFSYGVFAISFIFVVFFLSFCATSQGSLVSLVCQRSNLVLPLFFLFRFPPVPFWISGRDPLVVVECCNAPDLTRQVSASYSTSLPCHFLACCILSCHHVHCIFLFSKLASVRVLFVLFVVRS